MTSPGIMMTMEIEQDSKYALPTAPATVPQEVDASLMVRRQVAQSVQVRKLTERVKEHKITKLSKRNFASSPTHPLPHSGKVEQRKRQKHMHELRKWNDGKHRLNFSRSMHLQRRLLPRRLLLYKLPRQSHHRKHRLNVGQSMHVRRQLLPW